MVSWVEKASFEKIKRLLEISERERHHEILLTVKNHYDLNRSPSPYSIPVIPRPLPAEIVEGEHFVIADLQHLVLGSSSPARNSKTEAVGRELEISTKPEKPSLAREDSGLAPQVSKKRNSRPERLSLAKKGSCPAPQASKKGRRAPEWFRALGSGMEDFIPSVSPIFNRPPAREEEEEEEEEEDETADIVRNFIARKRKKGAIFKRATDAIPEVAGEATQQPFGGPSNVQAIIVLNSPEMSFHSQSSSETALLVDSGEVSLMGFHGQSTSELAPLVESREVSLTPVEVREDIPPVQVIGRSDRVKSTRDGHSRSLLPDQLLLNSYIPPQGQAPPMEEVSAPGPEGAQEIINRWSPFN